MISRPTRLVEGARAHLALTPRRFTLALAALAAGLAGYVGFFYALNFHYDHFGLWHSRDAIRVFCCERTSKYLLSLRYVPEHFEGIVVGSSVSDNLDTRQLRPYRVYNLSLNGSNITELSFAARGFIESGKGRFVVVCLNPYMTKNRGFKDNSFTFSTWYSAALFSEFATELTRRKLADEGPDPGFEDSAWGWNNYDPLKRAQGIVFEKTYQRIIRSDRAVFNIDPRAVAELDAFLKEVRRNGLQVFAYYYPNNYWSHRKFLNSGIWQRYKATIDALFDERDVVWDLNTPAYDHIRKNFAAYSDRHLTQVGEGYVIDSIREKLDAFYGAEGKGQK